MPCKGAEVQWAIGVASGRDLGLEPPNLSVFIGSVKPVASLVFPTVKTCLCAPRGERESREGVDQNLPLTEIIRKKKKS